MKKRVLLAPVVAFTSIKYSIGTSPVEPVAAGQLGNQLKEFPRKNSSKVFGQFGIQDRMFAAKASPYSRGREKQFQQWARVDQPRRSCLHLLLCRVFGVNVVAIPLFPKPGSSSSGNGLRGYG